MYDYWRYNSSIDAWECHNESRLKYTNNDNGPYELLCPICSTKVIYHFWDHRHSISRKKGQRWLAKHECGTKLITIEFTEDFGLPL
jgi:hypothetical protein